MERASETRVALRRAMLEAIRLFEAEFEPHYHEGAAQQWGAAWGERFDALQAELCRIHARVDALEARLAEAARPPAEGGRADPLPPADRLRVWLPVSRSGAPARRFERSPKLERPEAFGAEPPPGGARPAGDAELAP